MVRVQGEQVSSGLLGIDWRSGLGRVRTRVRGDKTSSKPGQAVGTEGKEGGSERAQEERGCGLAWELRGHSEERVVTESFSKHNQALTTRQELNMPSVTLTPPVHLFHN